MHAYMEIFVSRSPLQQVCVFRCVCLWEFAQGSPKAVVWCEISDKTCERKWSFRPYIICEPAASTLCRRLCNLVRFNDWKLLLLSGAVCAFCPHPQMRETCRRTYARVRGLRALLAEWVRKTNYSGLSNTDYRIRIWYCRSNSCFFVFYYEYSFV